MLSFIVKVRALLIPACLLCVFAVQQGNAQVYKTVDAQGNVVFTDKKPDGVPAEVVDIQPTNTASTTGASDNASSNAAPATTVRYTQFSVVSPANNQTMDYGVSSVDVSVVLEPGLQEGHKIQFMLDGKPYGPAGTSLSIALGNLERGTHSVQAKLLGKHGGALRFTATINFTIQLDQQGYQDGGYYDYPYGARSPRGARSPDGANTPRDVNGDIGADSASGFGSPEENIEPPPRPTHHRFRGR